MVEKARYEVLRKIGKVEIRRYPLLMLARVDGYGDGGFNVLKRQSTEWGAMLIASS